MKFAERSCSASSSKQWDRYGKPYQYQVISGGFKMWLCKRNADELEEHTSASKLQIRGRPVPNRSLSLKQKERMRNAHVGLFLNDAESRLFEKFSKFGAVEEPAYPVGQHGEVKARSSQ